MKAEELRKKIKQARHNYNRQRAKEIEGLVVLNDRQTISPYDATVVEILNGMVEVVAEE